MLNIFFLHVNSCLECDYLNLIEIKDSRKVTIFLKKIFYYCFTSVLAKLKLFSDILG